MGLKLSLFVCSLKFSELDRTELPFHETLEKSILAVSKNPSVLIAIAMLDLRIKRTEVNGHYV